VHLQLRVDHRQPVDAHLARAHEVVVRAGVVQDPLPECRLVRDGRAGAQLLAGLEVSIRPEAMEAVIERVELLEAARR
jgi:hypothetical protein